MCSRQSAIVQRKPDECFLQAVCHKCVARDNLCLTNDQRPTSVSSCGVRPHMNVCLTDGDEVLFDPIHDHDKGTRQDSAAEKGTVIGGDR